VLIIEFVDLTILGHILYFLEKYDPNTYKVFPDKTDQKN
jgi:hypothetical protein